MPNIESGCIRMNDCQQKKGALRCIRIAPFDFLCRHGLFGSTLKSIDRPLPIYLFM